MQDAGGRNAELVKAEGQEVEVDGESRQHDAGGRSAELVEAEGRTEEVEMEAVVLANISIQGGRRLRRGCPRTAPRSAP